MTKTQLESIARLFERSGPEWRLAFMWKHDPSEVKKVLFALETPDSIDGLLKAIHAPMKGC